MILNIDETGVLVEYQTQPFKVARYCVRKQVRANSDGSGSGVVRMMRDSFA